MAVPFLDLSIIKEATGDFAKSQEIAEDGFAIVYKVFHLFCFLVPSQTPRNPRRHTRCHVSSTGIRREGPI